MELLCTFWFSKNYWDQFNFPGFPPFFNDVIKRPIYIYFWPHCSIFERVPKRGCCATSPSKSSSFALMLSRTLEAACRGSLLFYSNKPSRKEKLDITSLVFSEIFVELSVSCMLLAFLRPCMEADVDDDVASCHRPTTTEKRLSLRSLQSILVGQTLNTWSTILKKIWKKGLQKR